MVTTGSCDLKGGDGNDTVGQFTQSNHAQLRVGFDRLVRGLPPCFF